MKSFKILAISLLSILLCSNAFGAYQGFFKKALTAAYGTYLLGPGIASGINNYQLMKMIKSDESIANDETTKKVRENLRQRGIQNTNNIRVTTSHRIISALFSDFRLFGRPKSIILNTKWESFDPLEQSAMLGHEASHIKNHDIAVKGAIPWLIRPLGHVLYSLALKHPVARIAQLLTSSKKIGMAIKGTAQIATIEGTRLTLSDEPYFALIRAQERRADTELLKDYLEQLVFS